MNNFVKGIFAVFLCGISFSLFSQNVGINTTGTTPSTNSILDLNTGNARNVGLLIPRVKLGSSLATFNPPMAHAATTADTDMIVYNSVATNQPIGYYYWNGLTWAGVAAGTAWSLTGNTGTSPGTNFLGTKDGEALEFQVNGQKSGWIDYASPYNTGFGYDVLFSVSGGISNTAFGYQGLLNNTSGSYNTSTGYQTLVFNTSGGSNTANGSDALEENTTGSWNTAMGGGALQNNMVGADNTAVGYDALLSNTTSFNTAVGYTALQNNTSGTSNTAMGYQVLISNSSGSYNTSMGYQAMFYTTTGSYNTGIGTDALDGVTTGGYNTALGYSALGGAVVTSSCTGVGSWSGINNTGNKNVFVGDSAGAYNTTGVENTYVGYEAGNNSSLTTFTNVVCLGYNSANGAGTIASNAIYMGNASTSKIYSTPITLSAYSDRRIKDSIKENVPGLAFITKLHPVTYHLDIHKQNKMLSIHNDQDYPGKYDIEKITQTGFIAQQVDSAAMACGYDFSGVERPQTPNGLYTLGYTTFVVPLVKAVQELSAKNDSLTKALQSIQACLTQLCANQASNNNSNSFSNNAATNIEDVTLSTSGSTPILYQNTPNPFSTGTKINYFLPEGTTGATIVFYDTYGNKIKEVQVNQTGNETIHVSSDNLTSGIYAYSLIVNGTIIDTKKMVLQK